MDISQYYDQAKKIGELTQREPEPILIALNYDSENDHPSMWVPSVQSSLLSLFRESPDSEVAKEALGLYVQGEILEDRAERNLTVKVGFSCLVIGIIIGWLIWA